MRIFHQILYVSAMSPRFFAVAILMFSMEVASALTSDVFGSIRLSLPASTDTPVAVPLARPNVWEGRVASVSTMVINVTGEPGWTSGAFAPAADTYYVRFRSGALIGVVLTVNSNSTNGVTVAGNGLDLSSVTSGDSVEIAPYWTLGTLYPATEAGQKFTATTNMASLETELLFFDESAVGINRKPSFAYYFYNGAWRRTGSPENISFNNTLIYPDSYFIQRNKGTATTATINGRVLPGSVGAVLEGGIVPNDNHVALCHPMPVTLAQSGLVEGGFTPSPSAGKIADRLLLFDNTESGFNRAPSAVYYYYDGGWRRVGSPVANDYGGTVTIPVGSGFIVRKASSASSSVWEFNTQL